MLKVLYKKFIEFIKIGKCLVKIYLLNNILDFYFFLRF